MHNNALVMSEDDLEIKESLNALGTLGLSDSQVGQT